MDFTDLKARKLFGGALKLSCPTQFIDGSQFRQVPDHQEVLLDQGSSDSCLIIEILEMDRTSKEEPAKFHFEQLVIDNEATASEIVHQESVVNVAITNKFQAHAHLLVGQQLVSKFGKNTKENAVNIWIFMAVYRLSLFQTDILVTLSAPTSTFPEWQATLNHFKAIATSLQIIDPELFGSDE